MKRKLSPPPPDKQNTPGILYNMYRRCNDGSALNLDDFFYCPNYGVYKVYKYQNISTTTAVVNCCTVCGTIFVFYPRLIEYNIVIRCISKHSYYWCIPLLWVPRGHVARASAVLGGTLTGYGPIESFLSTGNSGDFSDHNGQL